ncbi:hypothetical protein [Actinomadura mexicana]|uniref:Uncharacterized protein n=1 Tax=Actinomadura mexicana TaxID=134959 RepID=A0A238VNF0_9ACTN|nr:hypothetical protein [Actinomadura mexicana]SNR35009.1 hypothetical protein SAMN06265355_10210 [Actinomadura mexicana]
MARRRPNLDEPGLPEALAAYELFLDDVVTESEHGTREENGDVVAACGDIIERAARRAEREQRCNDKAR